jgi:hypothetical protein
MRKIINSTYLSLDGVIENSQTGRSGDDTGISIQTGRCL